MSSLQTVGFLWTTGNSHAMISGTARYECHFPNIAGHLSGRETNAKIGRYDLELLQAYLTTLPSDTGIVRSELLMNRKGRRKARRKPEKRARLHKRNM
jgi:hypothetical protein